MQRKNGFRRSRNSVRRPLTRSKNRRSSTSNNRQLDFQSLEPRQLLAADCLEVQPLDSLNGQSELTASRSPQSNDATTEQQQAAQNISLPAGLPQSFSTTIVYEGETLTLQLDKTSVYGQNTRFLVDDGSGELVQIDHGVDRSYVGTVAEHPEFVVSAVLAEEGLFANVIRPGQISIAVEPLDMSQNRGLHSVSLGEAGEPNDYDGHDHDHDGHEDDDHGITTDPLNPTAASTSPITTIPPATSTSGPVSQRMTSGATLPPTRVMDVYEFEIAVEIGSAAYLNNYSSNMSLVQSVVAGIPGNLNARFLNSAGVRHRLGTVIIRTSAAQDKFNVSNGNDVDGLNAFRDYWNRNRAEVGNTHDLAVYHVRGNPSGLAYVNRVGTSNRYLLSASNGATSWADGTLAHEVGHQWNLPHVTDSLFYESKPRSNGNAAGGNDVFVSIMDGRGAHNIGRLATDEANRVFAARQDKLFFGDLISDPGNIKPFGHRDSVDGNGRPITIDVIANDFDVNNDVLNLQLRDTVSQQGATISLSVGTGPGGRDEILYTPGAGTAVGTDFFHYTVVDSTGRSDWGAVYVENLVPTVPDPTVVDLTQTNYFYDIGTPTSPVFTGGTNTYTGISETTFGDISFVSNGTNAVESRDRGGSANAINRDHIRLRSASTFNHALADGRYRVQLTVGDANENTGRIRLTAEDSVTLTTESHDSSTFTNYSLNNVEVTDGSLTLDIDNLGFSSNITRIIIRRTGDVQPPVAPTATTTRSGGQLDGSDLARPDQLGQVSIAFDQNVTATAGEMSLFNVTNSGSQVNLEGMGFSYSSTSQSATLDFSTLTTPLEPGYYDFILGPGVKSVETGLAVQGDGVAGAYVQRIYVAIPGDADLDGDVDIIDSVNGGDGFTFVRNLRTRSGATWADGDFDGDGDVDVLGDGFALVRNLGNNVRPKQPPAALTPEAAAEIEDVQIEDVQIEDAQIEDVQIEDSLSPTVVVDPSESVTIASSTRTPELTRSIERSAILAGPETNDEPDDGVERDSSSTAILVDDSDSQPKLASSYGVIDQAFGEEDWI